MRGAGKTTLVKTLQRAAVDSTRSEATDGAARLSVDVRWLHHATAESLGELFGDMEIDGSHDPHWRDGILPSLLRDANAQAARKDGAAEHADWIVLDGDVVAGEGLESARAPATARTGTAPWKAGERVCAAPFGSNTTFQSTTRHFQYE